MNEVYMKRFITYLYAYKEGQKTKNTGYIRVDIRGSLLDMQVNIKETELNNTKGIFYILIKKENITEIPLTEICVKAGEYKGRVIFDCKEGAFDLGNIVGIRISYENGDNMASCWKEGEEDAVADTCRMGDCINQTENIMAVSVEKEEEDGVRSVAILEQVLQEEAEQEWACRKINLKDIHSLPSGYWHFSNNSFLLHGFWNYGYLVVKEKMEKDTKRIALGVPGIFEQPEMVMATYFGFPEFEEISSQEMEIGKYSIFSKEKKNQQPQAGTFGYWFVEL